MSTMVEVTMIEVLSQGAGHIIIPMLGISWRHEVYNRMSLLLCCSGRNAGFHNLELGDGSLPVFHAE